MPNRKALVTTSWSDRWRGGEVVGYTTSSATERVPLIAST